MARFATPGVYIKEKSAFSSSVVAVPTAVPAFIGYTEKAARGRTSLINKPTRVTSLNEYMTLFGGGPKTTFSIKAKGDQDFELNPDKNTQFNLFNSIRLFYANGGGTCYIVSVGDYSKGVNAKDLNNPENNGGVQALLTEQEPTLVVIPDATLLEADECYSLYQAVLLHCGGATKSRFGIFDVHNGFMERTFDKNDVVSAFREGVGSNFLAFGAGYYPWVKTTIVSRSDVSFQQISNLSALAKLLTKEAEATFLGGEGAPEPAKPAAPAKEGEEKKAAPAKKASEGPAVDEKTMKKFQAVVEQIKKLEDQNANPTVVDQNLKAISSMYRQVLANMREQMNLMPASGAMAGVYSMVDDNIGVHKAPANVSLSAVVSPAVNLTSENQEDLNTPIDGKAVNAIRSFIGKGVVVWGARTLDGNSQDWRYISVRRTLIFIEQSIKNAVESYVFEPNTAQTWLKVKTSIDNFLTGVWRTGALVGISPAEAFDTTVGLGATMTPVDVLDGIMRISVRVAVTRPAEFIEITFEQKMQEGGAGEGGGEEGGGEEGGE